MFLTLAALTTLALPYLVGKMIKNGLSINTLEIINIQFIWFIILSIIMAISSAFRYYFVMLIGERVVVDLRIKLYEQLLRLDQKFYQKNLTGDLLSRLSSDSTSIKSTIGVSVSLILRNIFILIGSIIMMFTTSSYLSLLVISIIPLMIIPLVIMGSKVRVLAKDAQTSFASTTAYAGETLSGIHTIQSFTYEKQAIKFFKFNVINAFNIAVIRIKAQARLIFISILIIFTSIIGVLWIGVYEVLKNNMDIGYLSQFVIYAVLAASSLTSISRIWGEIQQMAGASSRIMQLLDITPKINIPKKAIKLTKKIQGIVKFENVFFSYGKIENNLFNGLNFKVNKGEIVALVGLSGVGKTTIFNLLMRFYNLNSGKIYLDNYDISLFNPKFLRSQFATVSQDVIIFAINAMENIRFGRITASDEEVIEASKAAEAHDFIIKTTYGYKTIFGERGMILSGGQRQRIAIARAILRDAKVLLLDEATSSLDSESEKKVLKAIKNMTEGKTTLVVAHRLSTIRNANRILVIDNGKVVEEGNHQELISKIGIYSKLVKFQY